MSKNNIGLWHAKESKWLPFIGDRMAKPVPYATDANPEAFRQWLEASSKDASVQLRRIPKAELDRLKAGGLG